MALSKIQTGYVDTNAIGATELNLTDNFAFTGTVTGAGTLVKLAHTTVAVGDADNYPFNFTDVFSSTYNNYFFTFTVATNATGVSGQHFYCQFGNGGTWVTASNAVRGGSTNLQTQSSATVGVQNYLSVAGIHQLNGTLNTTENGMFTGTGIITNPFSSYYPVQVQTKCIMQYFSTEVNSWGEEGYSREDNGDKASYTDVRFGIIQGNSAYSGVGSAATRRLSYGHMTIYGMVD